MFGADVIDETRSSAARCRPTTTFEPCTLADNPLGCRRNHDAQEAAVVAQAGAILERETLGTDIFGALELAAQFFAAYRDAERRTLANLSDMVQSDRRHRIVLVRLVRQSRRARRLPRREPRWTGGSTGWRNGSSTASMGFRRRSMPCAPT